MAKATDANQQGIMDAFRMLGGRVVDLHTVGHGCPDLVVSCPVSGSTFLVEVKMPGKKQNALELAFQRAWCGHLYVIHNVYEATRAYLFENTGILIDGGEPLQKDPINQIN